MRKQRKRVVRIWYSFSVVWYRFVTGTGIWYNLVFRIFCVAQCWFVVSCPSNPRYSAAGLAVGSSVQALEVGICFTPLFAATSFFSGGVWRRRRSFLGI